jgi:hypothetical protein
MVDFGENVLIRPESYTFKYASSGSECCPRNWMLQAAVTFNPEVSKTTKCIISLRLTQQPFI